MEMSELEEVGDQSEYAHLPSGQRLYHLLLAMSDEQVVHGELLTLPMHYSVLGELWSDVEELSLLMLEQDPGDPTAADYRTKWAEIDASYGDPRRRGWRMPPTEGRERSRVIKRFLLRAGLLSLRRRQGDSSRDYWAKEAMELQ